MSTFTSGWLAKIMGVLFRTTADVDIGRTDVIKIGSGITGTWDAAARELTIAASYIEDDLLDLTGIDVQTSSGSIETLERGVAALDAGADGAPVAVVAYTVPVGYKATLRCWVCGETNSTQVPAFDTQWVIKCYRKTGGNVTQYAAAVTPNDEADPTTASVAVTYGLSGGVVTLYKANTSGTAMRFSGQIVVSLDALVGAGA